jgi:hypothetical protein
LSNVSNSFSQIFCSVDNGFPVVTFHFEGDLSLNVQPHDYLFQNGVINLIFCLVFSVTSNITSIVLAHNSIVLYFQKCTFDDPFIDIDNITHDMKTKDRLKNLKIMMDIMFKY